VCIKKTQRDSRAEPLVGVKEGGRGVQGNQPPKAETLVGRSIEAAKTTDSCVVLQK